MLRYYSWDVDSNKNWRRKEWNVPERDDKSNMLVITVSLNKLRDNESNFVTAATIRAEKEGQS